MLITVNNLRFARLPRVEIVQVVRDYIQRHPCLQPLPMIRISFRDYCYSESCRVWGWQTGPHIAISAYQPSGRVVNCIDQLTTLYHELRHLEQDETGIKYRDLAAADQEAREQDAELAALQELARWMHNQYQRQRELANCELPADFEGL